jgi:hypothetical protein
VIISKKNKKRPFIHEKIKEVEEGPRTALNCSELRPPNATKMEDPSLLFMSCFAADLHGTHRQGAQLWMNLMLILEF